MRTARNVAKKYHRFHSFTHCYEEFLSESYWGLVLAHVRQSLGKLPPECDWNIYVKYRCRRAIRNYLEGIAKFKAANDLKNINDVLDPTRFSVLEGYLDVLKNDLQLEYILHIIDGYTDEQFREKCDMSIHAFYQFKEDVLRLLEEYILL